MLPEKPVHANYLPKQPHALVRWFPLIKNGYRRKLDEANGAYQIARTAYNNILEQRSHFLSQLEKDSKIQNNAVLEFARNYTAGEPRAVSTYFELILGRSQYPEPFPPDRQVAYVPESKQLIVEFELPTLANAIPTAEKYRYVRKSDEVLEVKRSEKF